MKNIIVKSILITSLVSLVPITAFAQTTETATKVTASKIVAGYPTLQDKVIDTALSLKGIPYFKNGTTEKGFDSSAFIQYSFKQSGIKSPRTTAELYKAVEINKSTPLQKGDIVFFDTTSSKNTKVKPSFAGLYIGNNQFVAVTVSKGVSVQNLTDSYWKYRFVGGGSLIK